MLEGQYMMVCDNEGRNRIDLQLIKGEEAMDALVLEVNKKPAIRIFWGVAGFIGGILVTKAID